MITTASLFKLENFGIFKTSTTSSFELPLRAGASKLISALQPKKPGYSLDNKLISIEHWSPGNSLNLKGFKTIRTKIRFTKRLRENSDYVTSVRTTVRNPLQDHESLNHTTYGRSQRSGCSLNLFESRDFVHVSLGSLQICLKTYLSQTVSY